MKNFLKKQFGTFINETVSYKSQVEADERRKENEWELGPNCPEVGWRAHALYNYLVSEGEISEFTDEDKIKEKNIRDEIERLNKEYDEKEETDTDILDTIEDLEDELDNMEKYDVYDIIPDGQYYDLQRFVVLKPDLQDRGYTVGTEDEMYESGKDAVREFLEELGIDSFNKNFVMSHIDDEKVKDFADRMYRDDVYDNPEAWIDESERELSREQINDIQVLELKISNAEDQIEYLENMENEGYDVKRKIEDFENLIEDFKSEIEDIEGEPDGDYPEDKMDEKIDELVDDAVSDPSYFIRSQGLDISDFVDEDELIESAVDEDGPAHFLNRYDGSSDSIRIGEKYYEVMRID